MTEHSDSPNFYELKTYAMVASLWYSSYLTTLDKQGSVQTYNGVYTSKEALKKDIEKQIEDMIESGEMIMNITCEEALAIIFDNY